MHELGIAESILRATLDQARSANAARVLRVGIRVGALAGVDPDALRFAFTVVRAGTAADEADLEIEPVAASGQCAACGTVFPAEDDVFFGVCPTCGSSGAVLRSGRELQLVRLEFSLP